LKGRLLVYGGRSYKERRRVGLWAGVPTEALASLYGLDRGRLSYGVGWLFGKEPVLIVRQLQNVLDRGGYPLSILLDPGRAVWERFGWNAAALTFTLFEQADAPGRLLLEEPDAATQESLDTLLESLEPPQLRAELSDARFISLLVCDSVLPEPIDGRAVALGLEREPTPYSLARLLESLPPCFRCGAGWLVAGGKETGKALGSCLVMDESSKTPPADFEKRAERGQRLLDAWRSVERDGEFRTELSEASRIPAREWEAKWGVNPEQIARQVELWAGLINASDPEAALASAVPRLDEAQIFSGPIRRAARRVAASGQSGQLRPACTAFLLGEAFDRGEQVEESVARRLDPTTVAAELLRRTLTPPEVEGIIPLHGPLRFAVWYELIISQADCASLPSRLAAALNDIARHSVSDGARPDAKTRLTQLAVARSIELGCQLRVWSHALHDPALAPLIGPLLRESALKAAAQGGERWQLDYLLFGRDAGGRLLAELALSPEKSDQLVQTFLDAADGDAETARLAEEWLLALSSSPLRREIGITAKIRIADCGTPTWDDLRAMLVLYRGGEIEPGARPAITNTARFHDELRALFEVAPPRKHTPNLRGLAKLAAPLPGELLRLIAESRPPLSFDNAEDWLGGWSDLGEIDVRRGELCRLFVESELPVATCAAALSLAEQNFTRELCHYLLFGDNAQADARCRIRLEELLTNEPCRERHARRAASACGEGVRREETCAHFIRRYAFHPRTLGTLFGLLDQPTRSLILSAAARSDIAKFSAQALTMLGSILGKAAPNQRPGTDLATSVGRSIEASGESQKAVGEEVSGSSAWKRFFLRFRDILPGREGAHASEEIRRPGDVCRDAAPPANCSSEFYGSSVARAQPSPLGEPETVYRLSLARYLASPEGRPALDEISRQCPGRAPAGELAAELRNFLRGAHPAPPEEA
jgi:hypothetical protein